MGNIHKFNTARYVINKLLKPTHKPHNHASTNTTRLNRVEATHSKKKDKIKHLVFKCDKLSSTDYLIDVLYFGNDGIGRADF